MGVQNLGALFNDKGSEIKEKLQFSDLSRKRLGLDAFNQLFQFLASIRGHKGQLLRDAEGNVTSHLIGLLTRNCNLLKKQIHPIYVFDGESPELKKTVQEKRHENRNIAKKKYKKAIDTGNLEKAKQFAKQTSNLNLQIIEDSQNLLEAMGIPWVQAPGEAEAQAAQMVKEKIVWATVSQDYDALLFGSSRMIRNLNITGKRKLPGGGSIDIHPELIRLESFLNSLGITYEQLIDLGILLGTDFNPEGIYGIGPKTAMKYIKKYDHFAQIEKKVKTVSEVNIPYRKIKDIFLNPNIKKDISIDFSQKFNPDRILEFLVEERDFAPNRYEKLISSTASVLDE